MQNIEELIQQVLNEETSSAVQPDVVCNHQQSAQDQRGLKVVRIPISLSLLDNLNDLKTLSPWTPTSPVLPSGGQQQVSPTSTEYEAKVATINEIIRKMIQKHVKPLNLPANYSISIDYPDSSAGNDADDADDSDDEDDSVFGPLVAPRRSRKERAPPASKEREMQVNWVSVIMKLHQTILQSTLHQQLLKKIASAQTEQSSTTLLSGLKDTANKTTKPASLSSNSLVGQTAKPDRSAGSPLVETHRSTPTTPATSSPTASSPTVASPQLRNVMDSLRTTASNFSSFSLSALMSQTGVKDAPAGLKELAERSSRVDASRGIPPSSATLQQQYANSPTTNPNINKLPSTFETDPVMLPDGSEYQNSMPIPNFQDRFPSSMMSSSFTSAGSHPSSIPIPLTSNIVSPSSYGGASSYQGPGSNVRVSSSPYEFVPSTQGVPPMRLADSFFPSMSSRGGPSFDGPSSLLSVSPSGSSMVGSNPLNSSKGFTSIPISQTSPSSIIMPTSSPVNSAPILTSLPVVPAPQVQTAPPMIDTIVPASSSFKHTHDKGANNIQPLANHLGASSTSVDQTLPSWLDISIYWTDSQLDAKKEKDLADSINIDLRAILLAERAVGRLDHYISSLLVSTISRRLADTVASKTSPWLDQVHVAWTRAVNAHYHSEVATALPAIVAEYRGRMWTPRRYRQTLDKIVNLRRRFPPVAPSAISQEEETEMAAIVKALQDDALYLITVQATPSLKRIERLAVGLLGHNSALVRLESVRLLNALYDAHAWQFDGPFKPVIRVIGDAFKVELELEAPLPDELLKRVFVLTTSPPSLKTSALPSSHLTVYTRHKPRVEGTKLLFEAPASFYRAGYYDWRFVELTSNGTFVPFDFQTYRLCASKVGATSPIEQSAQPAGQGEISLIQGRFIVHPKLREEIMHEVWIDLQDAVWDPYRGEMARKGSLAALVDALDGYHKDGVTTLYVMGLLERLPSGNPFCPTDRELPNRATGGSAGFTALINRARALGIKIVVDQTTKLSSKQAHRKYNGSICHTLDSRGQLQRLEGTDSAEFTWPDCVMSNMRKVSVWEALVGETLSWGARGADGVRIDGAHTCPLLFRADLDELHRLDSDNLPHFSNQQIFDGEIVRTPNEEGRAFGYWGTTPPSPKQSTPFYPNPLFIKMTREVWHRHPTFVFLAEVYWERELHAIVSGLVPYSSAIPRALASVFDKGISKDGVVFDLRARQSVKALYDYYEMRMSTYPQNAIILFPSSTHHAPYPLAIYNAGAWAAVDMLYFLPEIPITYIGEQHGWYYNVDIQSGRVKQGAAATPYQLQYQQIGGHYAHRINLRKNHTLLRRGGMIPLLCYHASGWHERVFGFARFSGDELAIIAINFDNHDTEFYVDCSPLARVSTSEETIYRMVDLINPSNPPQYLSLNELLYEKHFVVVPGFSSICWGVFHQVSSPAAVRVLYEHSMIRLKQLLADDVDPQHNLIYSMLKRGLASVEQFSKALEDILSNLSGNAERTFSSFIQGVLYHLTRHCDGHKIISYLEVIASRLSVPRIPKICREVLQHNILGPIVFVTPEIGRFSTVGGVGVMLDELTRSLQLLGCEVHIISPYYNYGKGGRTGYLEKEEGIKWSRNVVTYVGPDKVEVGVHEGSDRGLHLHFLHHFDYFPTPYNSGSPVHQLKTIVLFAKASLELLCQIRVLPSVIVTNDWFTGLVPAYAKAGAFGTTFNGTTFFHLVHNLEEAYQGRIYPDGGDDLNWIHQLHRDLIMEPHSQGLCLNASRCALLTCNNWGTVSKSYLYDLLRTSQLAALLHRFPQAFVKERRTQLLTIASGQHKEAKALLQKKYFNNVDNNIPVFSFVGRIVLQKGVHLILNAMRELVNHYQGKIQVLIGGMANMKDPYAASCAWSMQALCKQYPNSFWADPDAFFSDGSLVNLGSDFGLMPSLFEPSGVVQQEYFAAGTPVIAFKTGGLKDTVFEYNMLEETGNGFTFEAHKHTDFVQAVHRSVGIFSNAHHYKRIRETSYESVLDMSVVAEAWAKEFSRMRRSIWADN
eukprot:gene7805-9157_t